MDIDYNKIEKRRLFSVWFLFVVVAIASLVVLEYMSLTKENRIRAYKASDILITEIEHIIETDETDKISLENFLKENYISKARTISYLLDRNPEIENDVSELRKLAHQMDIDEIHIFDDQGIIVAGSNPRHLGLSMHDGDQVGFFLPMLEDKSLTLSQNVVPNTADGAQMFYAACWNETGTRVIQVGTKGERFPPILNSNQIETIIGKIPDGNGWNLILTKTGNSTIVASTEQTQVGRTLQDLGIDLEGEYQGTLTKFSAGFRNNPFYCTVKPYGDYQIIVIQYKNFIDEYIPFTLVTFTEYLILVFVAMSFLLDYMYGKFLQEKNEAIQDKLTGLYNRREYENTLTEYTRNEVPEDFIFVAMDVNGLKNVNDTKGHEAGDKLLQGAAWCMRRCYGPYGKLFRYGGDEFVAIIHTVDSTVKLIHREFVDTLEQWSKENGLSLWMSIGYGCHSEYPQASVRELAQIADKAMYADKAEFYARKAHDRRGKNHENQQN